jgi:hypothetical protein
VVPIVVKEYVDFVVMNLEPLKMKPVDNCIMTIDNVTGHKTGILHFYIGGLISFASTVIFLFTSDISG